MPVSEAEAANVIPPNGWLHRYVRHGFQQTTAPLVYHIGVGLTMLASTCPIDYGTPYAGTLRTNNFCLLVGRSGEDRKSSALNVGKEILDAAAPKLIGDYPGSPEGLMDSLAKVPSQMIPISEMGKLLSSAQSGYFEPIKTMLADAWDCYRHSTYLLSEYGWRHFNEISIGDKVWALDPATDKLVLSKVLDVGSRQVRPGEKMVRLKSLRHDICTTEGHRYYIKYRNPKNGYKPSDKYLVKTGKQMVERKSSYYLPFSADPEKLTEDIALTDDELRFIAWAITDSTLVHEKDDTLKEVRLSQTEHKYLERIRNLLTRLGMSWSESEGNRDTNYGKRTSSCWSLYISKKSWTPYKSFIDKDLAPELLKMNRRQFDIFWHELLLADGEQVKTEGSPGYLWSTRETFIDNLQHLAVINGLSTQYGTRELPSGKTGYRMSVFERHHVLTDPGNKKSVQFEYEEPEPGEVVWCATTEHGTLVTRNNGKVVILGNCLPLQRAKANNKTVRVATPRLSIGAACSIPYLEKHTLSEDWTGGFMGRWLVLYGRRERTDPDPVGNRQDFPWLVAELKRRAQHGKAGWCQGLDGGARLYWDAWFHDVMARQLPHNIVGIRARAPTLARKIALIYGWDFGPAMAGQPWRMDISILEPAIEFVELHIQSLIDLSEVIADHPDARLRRSVLMAIESKGGVATLGEILGVMKMRKRPIVEMLDALMEEGRVNKLKTSLVGVDCYESKGRVQII